MPDPTPTALRPLKAPVQTYEMANYRIDRLRDAYKAVRDADAPIFDGQVEAVLSGIELMAEMIKKAVP